MRVAYDRISLKLGITIQMASDPEKLPVDVRTISDKGHVVLRLNQLQRGILEDPTRFAALENDRSLSHLRKEVNALQSALMATVKAEATYEYQQLKRAAELVNSWESESELKDILLLDNHRFQDLQKEYHLCEGYPYWLLLIDSLRQERQRLLNKYQGYFEGQHEDLSRKRQDTQKKINPCLPKMEEWRKKLDELMQVQQQINYYTQQSMNALVSGMGAIMGLAVLFWWFSIWGSWFTGLVIGYLIFSNLAAHYAYLEGQPMKDLYTFLSERYPIKNVRPFFRFDNKENIHEPTRYDATRGEVLAGLMQKDIVDARSNYGQIERQHQEHVNYLHYLEGRSQWIDEQLRRLTEIATATYGKPVEEPPAPAPPEAPPKATRELQPIPPLPAGPAENETSKKPARSQKTRPAKIQQAPQPENSLTPERAS